MMNKCLFIGNCAADPEIKTAGQDTVANFRIGCSESWKDKNGEKQTATEWVSCVAWRKNAENIEKYVRKGQLLYIEGRMKTRAWEDKDGNKRYTTEILVDTFKMLGGKKEVEAGQPNNYSSADEIPY